MRRLLYDDRGQGMIEYGILLGTLALGVVLTLIAIGAQIRTVTSESAPQHMGEG
ncbi:MAG: Flp family type IVb pilin [Candidatus Binatia bacterium]